MVELGLVARSIDLSNSTFNWVFFLWYFVSAVLSILFLFYFNRLVASLVTCGIRAYTWHYYRIYIDVQALQISLLAGRIFFKNVRYHGRNETVIVHEGYVTWQYWLRHVQELDCRIAQGSSQQASAKSSVPSEQGATRKDGNGARGVTNEEVVASETKAKNLPCRVLLKAKGVEWFIYNRSPAYDAILSSIKGEDESHRARSGSWSDKERERSGECFAAPSRGTQTSLQMEPKEESDDKSVDVLEDEGLSSSPSNSSSQAQNEQLATLPAFLNLLPVGVECRKGAVVMGNQNTPSVLTAKFDGAVGKLSAGRPRACVDRYKQTFEFEFKHPLIEFKDNKDYTEPQINEGEKLLSNSEKGPNRSPRWYEFLTYLNQAQRTWNSFRDLVPYGKGSVESLNHPRTRSAGAHNLTEESAGAYGQNRWLGLTRYLDDGDDLVEQELWKGVEYGQFATIVDSASISMNLYWDVPGLVPEPINSSRSSGSEVDINGDAPPDWGIDLKVGGGTINYGPWADRQRASLQAVFFPTLYKDASPAKRLKSGQVRVSTVMKILLEIEEQTTLRVPMREESKDWRWKNHKMPATATAGKAKKTKQLGKGHKGKKKPSKVPEVRPPGWLDVKVLPDSAVRFTMDLFAKRHGYSNRVELDLKGVEMSSSVNHGLLWRSKSQTITCDLSNPPGWNTLRQWHFDIQDNGMELFILRDHMFLLTDLISDWTAGPPGDFHTFVPFKYSIGLRFTDFKLYLNANDSNIINNPSDFDDNTFVVVWGNTLKAGVVIPSTTFRPTQSKVNFNVEAYDGGFDLRTPPRNTQHTFLNRSDVASLKDLRIDGSYNYFTSTSRDLTDILLMDVYGLSPRIDLHGFLIRYFMKIKDNYFGDDIHFRTLEEYQNQMFRAGSQDSGDGAPAQHSRLSNDLDVILSVRAEKSCALLPGHLYSANENTRLEILTISGDLRITNYYMDLAVTSSPIAISYTSRSECDRPPTEDYSSTQIFIDGLELSGHRLFGLPPVEPTYVCNWDFDVGSVTGECSIDFLRCLSMSFRCFGLTFDDAENALPPLNPPVIHDVTFLRARISSASVGLSVEQATFLLGTGEVEVAFNDWAGALFSDRFLILIPDLILALVDSRGTSTNQTILQSKAKTHAYIGTTVKVNGVSRKHDFKAHRHLQQSHIILHDARTHRVPWLVHDFEHPNTPGNASRPAKARPPAMTFPSMPEPLSAIDHPTTGSVSLASSSSGSGFSRSTTSRGSKVSQPSNTEKVKPCQKQKVNPKSPTGTESRKNPEGARKGTAISAAEKTATGVNVEECPGKFGDFAHSSLSFSSPYKRPHFPLLGIQPDTSEVTSLPEYLAATSFHAEADNWGNPESQISDRATGHSSFLINLDDGFRVFCTPEALFLVTQSLFEFQATDAVTLLDSLQIDTMADVLSAGQEQRKEPQIKDFRVFVPWVAVRFVNTCNSSNIAATRQERYEITLDNLTTTASSSKQLSAGSETGNSVQMSIHVFLDEMHCSARESLEGKADHQALIGLSVNDLVLWIQHSESTAAELQFEKLEVISASREVDYISSLIRQTLILSEDLASRFVKLEKKRKSRLRVLVLLLMTEGRDVPDPLFLTRASYVLRTASHHVRASDSWKIMSRLRFIYQGLSAGSRDKLHAQCIHEMASCPQDTGERITASFADSSTWNLARVRSSLLMQRVYGALLNQLVSRRETIAPLKVSIKAAAIQVLVEPGPNQNEIAIKGLVIGLCMNQTLTSNRFSPSSESGTSKSVIQVHCVEIAIRLNWNLLGLLENVIQTVQATTGSGSSRKNASPEPQAQLTSQCLHIILSSELSTLSCDTPTLKVISLCQGLRTSVVAWDERGIRHTSSMSLLFDADAATSEIKSRSELLTSYKLRRPKAFASRNSNYDIDCEEPWKVIGIGEEILFQVLANPLQLIEAADCFLVHEVAHGLEWARSLEIVGNSARSSPATPNRTKLLKFQVALLLETYLISFGILPSLTYQINGAGAGSSVKSGPHSNHDVSIDFTLKDHSHVVKTKGDQSDPWDILSTLQMPPINGCLSLDLTPRQKLVDCCVSLESIISNASALHAIFTAVNRPEIVSLGNSISYEISTFQEHYKNIFDIDGSDKARESPNPILYNANVTIASLAVHARTSEPLPFAQGAELQLKMSRMQLKATNRDPRPGSIMRHPEFELRLKGIELHLLRYESLDLLPCGNVALKAILRSTSNLNETGDTVRSYQIQSSSLQIDVYAETAPVVVAILGHLHDTLRTVDLSHEVQNLRKLSRARPRHKRLISGCKENTEAQDNTGGLALFNAMYSLEMQNICVTWRIESSTSVSPGRQPENLILSFTKIELATKKKNAARLLIENFQLQMVPASKTSTARSSNSALLPEMVFNVAYVSTTQDWRLAFQAVGKALDLQLTSQFILPASDLRRSIALSIERVRIATADWKASATATDGQTKRLLGNKRLASLLVDADFAGAVVNIKGRSVADPSALAMNVPRGARTPQHGRYNQFTPENASNSSATLRAPGIALKVEYKNAGIDAQSLNAEMKIDASNNILYPTVVPLIMEISSSVKDVVGEPSEEESAGTKSNLQQPRFLDDERLRGADPSAIFGNCRLNLGLRVCRQEFSLSCQPIARVAATARFEDIYITVNTVQSPEHGKFFSVSGAFKSLQASVQHVYSRESTGSFEIESVVVSFINSKHVSSANGISAILNVSPMKAQVNGKQSQDFLLFREIWLPPEIRSSRPAAAPVPASESQAFIVQRYQQIAATGAFPWNATVFVAELDVQVDLGQSLGKSAFVITKFWISSQKTSDWEQNLCLGFDKMAVNSTGRMSGFVELQDLKLRTSIQWPVTQRARNQTPLVQASLAFDHLRVKAAFDYQAFAIADITQFEFLMYNVRDLQNAARDRLVGVLDGNKVQVFCTTTSSSQAIALYQAFQRLYREKVAAYETSLRDIEKFLRRKSSISSTAIRTATRRQEAKGADTTRSPLKLQTDVVITLKAVNIGAFPSTFLDNQIFKLEALDASARFSVMLDKDKVHSRLSMALGQLRIALAGITRASVPKTLGEVSVADVVNAATGSRGGTILKVPKLVATMETWQSPGSTQIDYLFKSSFQGKVDVGWNYSRISYIRGMWATHARALAQRLGKPLPQSAVQITGGPRPEGDEGSPTYSEGEKGKITAVVNVPQSKYQYTALQPAIIETPQLRDMGEATPPLEWIGLNREKLPNLTHQVVIVSLLEIAKEVDDAYSRILGSS